MDKIMIADQVQHAPIIRALFWEYLSWGVTNINQHYGLNFSARDTIEQDMLALDKFSWHSLVTTRSGWPV